MKLSIKKSLFTTTKTFIFQKVLQSFVCFLCFIIAFPPSLFAGKPDTLSRLEEFEKISLDRALKLVSFPGNKDFSLSSLQQLDIQQEGSVVFSGGGSSKLVTAIEGESSSMLKGQLIGSSQEDLVLYNKDGFLVEDASFQNFESVALIGASSEEQTIIGGLKALRSATQPIVLKNVNLQNPGSPALLEAPVSLLRSFNVSGVTVCIENSHLNPLHALYVKALSSLDQETPKIAILSDENSVLLSDYISIESPEKDKDVVIKGLLSSGQKGLKIKTRGDIFLAQILCQGPVEIETDGNITFLNPALLQGPLSIKAKNLIVKEGLTLNSSLDLDIKGDIVWEGRTLIHEIGTILCGGDWSLNTPFILKDKLQAKVGGTFFQHKLLFAQKGIRLSATHYHKSAPLLSSEEVTVTVSKNTILEGGLEKGTLKIEGTLFLKSASLPFSLKREDISVESHAFNHGKIEATETQLLSPLFLNTGHLQTRRCRVMSPEAAYFVNFGIFEAKNALFEGLQKILNEGVLETDAFALKGGTLISKKTSETVLKYYNRKGIFVERSRGTVFIHKKSALRPYYKAASGKEIDFSKPKAFDPSHLKEYRPFHLVVEDGLFYAHDLSLKDFGRITMAGDPPSSQRKQVNFSKSASPLLESTLHLKGGRFEADNLTLQMKDITSSITQRPSNITIHKTMAINLWGAFKNTGDIVYEGTAPLTFNFFSNIRGLVSLEGCFDHTGTLTAPNADFSLLGLGKGNGTITAKHFFYMPYFQKEDRLHGKGMKDPLQGIAYDHLLKHHDIKTTAEDTSKKEITEQENALEKERAEKKEKIQQEEISVHASLTAQIKRLADSTASEYTSRDSKVTRLVPGEVGRPGRKQSALVPSTVYVNDESQRSRMTQSIEANQALYRRASQTLAELPSKIKAQRDELTRDIAARLEAFITEQNKAALQMIKTLEGTRDKELEEFRKFLGDSPDFHFRINADTAKFGVCALDLKGIILAKVEADFSSTIDLRTGLDLSSGGLSFIDGLSGINQNGRVLARQNSVVLPQTSSLFLEGIDFSEGRQPFLMSGDIFAPSIRLGGARAFLNSRVGLRGFTQNIHITSQTLALMASGTLAGEEAHLASNIFVTTGEMDIGVLHSAIQFIANLGGTTHIDHLKWEALAHVLHVTGILKTREQMDLMANYLLKLGVMSELHSDKGVFLEAPVIDTEASFETAGDVSVKATSFLQRKGDIKASAIDIESSRTAILQGGSLTGTESVDVQAPLLYHVDHAIQGKDVSLSGQEGASLQGTVVAETVKLDIPSLDLRDLVYLQAPSIVAKVKKSLKIQIPTTVSQELFLETEGGLFVEKPLFFDENTEILAQGSFYNNSLILGDKKLHLSGKEGLNERRFVWNGDLRTPLMETGLIQAQDLRLTTTAGPLRNKGGDIVGYDHLGIKVLGGNLYHEAESYHTQGHFDRITRYHPARFLSGDTLEIDVEGVTYNVASHIISRGDADLEFQEGYQGETLLSTYVSDMGSKSSGFLGHKKKSWVTYQTDVYTPIVRSLEGHLVIDVPRGSFKNRGGPIMGRDSLRISGRDGVALGGTIATQQTVMKGSGFWGFSKSSGSATIQQAIPTYIESAGDIVVDSPLGSVINEGLIYKTPQRATFTAAEDVIFKEIKLYHSSYSKSRGLFFSNPVTDGLKSFISGASLLGSLGTVDPLFANIEALKRTHQRPLQYAEAGVKGILSALDFGSSLANCVNNGSGLPFVGRYTDIGFGLYTHKSQDDWTSSFISQGSSQDLVVTAGHEIGYLGGADILVEANADWTAPFMTLSAAQDLEHHTSRSTSSKVSYNAMTKQISVSVSGQSQKATGVNITPTVIRVGGVSNFNVGTLDNTASSLETHQATGNIDVLTARGLQNTQNFSQKGVSFGSTLPNLDPKGDGLNSAKINSASYHQLQQESASTQRASFTVTDQAPIGGGGLTIGHAILESSTLDTGGENQATVTLLEKRADTIDKSTTKKLGVEFSRTSNYGFMGFHSLDHVTEVAQRALHIGAGSQDKASDATSVIKDKQTSIDIPLFILDQEAISRQWREISEAFSRKRTSGYNARLRLQELSRRNALSGEDLPESVKENLSDAELTVFADVFTKLVQEGSSVEEATAVLSTQSIRSVLLSSIKIMHRLEAAPKETASRDLAHDLKEVVITIRPHFTPIEKVLRLTEQAGITLNEFDANYPWLTKTAVSATQIALMGPVRYVASEVVDHVAGSTIDKVKQDFYHFIAEKTHIHQQDVEVVSHCISFVASMFVSGSKHIVKDAKGIAKSAEKREHAIDVFIEKTTKGNKKTFSLSSQGSKTRAPSSKSIQSSEKVHGCSLSYVGDTHVYVMRESNGILYKVGESMQGVNKLGQSKRAAVQARKLFFETGKVHKTEIRRTFSTKAEARVYETKLIERYRKMFGDDLLPGNKGTR
ncbi:MAG: hypothetical protein B7X84_06195 [Alphaproteobacteria bacterium 17-39-52]|nr:MAG: hypothetical protein B7X84_06195 [Alphaproteobacteria bacterium 17-39-52]